MYHDVHCTTITRKNGKVLCVLHKGKKQTLWSTHPVMSYEADKKNAEELPNACGRTHHISAQLTHVANYYEQSSHTQHGSRCSYM
jgi:hypothetical protein